jgi:hypothetical protein
MPVSPGLMMMSMMVPLLRLGVGLPYAPMANCFSGGLLQPYYWTDRLWEDLLVDGTFR